MEVKVGGAKQLMLLLGAALKVVNVHIASFSIHYAQSKCFHQQQLMVKPEKYYSCILPH